MSLINKAIEASKNIKREIKLYKNIFLDKRTPLLARICFKIALGYLVLPFDIIPDFIPVIGQMDDILVFALFITLAIKLTPTFLVEEHRQKIIKAEKRG